MPIYQKREKHKADNKIQRTYGVSHRFSTNYMRSLIGVPYVAIVPVMKTYLLPFINQTIRHIFHMSHSNLKPSTVMKLSHG